MIFLVTVEIAAGLLVTYINIFDKCVNLFPFQQDGLWGIKRMLHSTKNEESDGKINSKCDGYILKYLLNSDDVVHMMVLEY